MTRTNNSSLLINNMDGAKAGNSRMVNSRRKRTSEQKEGDMVLIARLLTRECLSHTEIRDRLNAERPYDLSLTTIEKDISELHQRWKDAYLGDTNELMSRELKRIDNLEAAYWDSYERSLGDKEILREEEEEGENTGGSSPSLPAGQFRKKKNSRELHQRDGSVQFLDGIKWCINQRCDILGLKAPMKSELTLDWRTEAVKMGIDPNQLFNDLVSGFVGKNLVDEQSMDMNTLEINKMIEAQVKEIP